MPRLASRLRALFAGSAPSAAHPSVRTDRVAAWLFIGPALSPDGYATLREQGVTHIVDLRKEATDDAEAMARLGFEWTRVLIEDGTAPTSTQFAGLIEWLDAVVGDDGEHAVMLHCQAGLTRTPTVAIALLMHRGFTLAEAHRLVSAARPEVALSSTQLAWLETLAARG